MEETKKPNYQAILFFILKKFWILVLTAAVFGSAAFYISEVVITPQYKATILLYVNNKIEASDSLTSSDVSAAKSLVDTYITIIESDSVLGSVAEKVGNQYTNAQIKKMLSAKSVNGTEVFEVSITGPSPEECAAIANAIADLAPGKISEIVDGSSVKIVDRAKTPSSPVSPNLLKNVAAAVVLGIAVSCGLLFLLSVSDTTIYSEDDIKEFCTLPILGVLPDLNQAGKTSKKEENAADGAPKKQSGAQGNRFILQEETAFSVKEEYKTLRTNLQLSLPAEGCRIIGVTSAQPFEGKSINCLNLAITVSQMGARVLLLDCDLRIPTQARLVDLDAIPGISNVLVGMNPLEEAIQQTKYPNMDALLSGDIPPSPTELLASSKMGSVLEALSQKYDYIFVDLPPVNVIADTMIMAKYLSGLLFVVRSSASRRDSVIEAINRLELAHANIIGIMLVCIKNKKLPMGRYSRYSQYEKDQ